MEVARCGLDVDVKWVMLGCFFKHKTAYELRISDWSSDVCFPIWRGNRIARGCGRSPRGRAPPAASDALSGWRGCPPRAARRESRKTWLLAYRVVPSRAKALRKRKARGGQATYLPRVHHYPARSEESRYGKEGVSACRFRWVA